MPSYVRAGIRKCARIRALSEEFRETTKKLGLSTADALRMFVSSFNEYQGFPYQVRVRQVAEPFENEREASDFANDLSMRMIADEEG